MKRICATAFAILIAATTFAQNADDACLYSQTYYQGTAKAMAMGNALGAVGGDITSICINPASMGIYRSNEFTMSLNLLDNYYSSRYYGTDTGSNKTRFSLPNLGLVFTKQRSNYRPLRFTQFGIGLTRTNDYNFHSLAKGLNPSSSRINNSSFLNQIQGIHPDDLPDDSWYLWQAYLIDDNYSDFDGYYYTSNVPGNNVWQSLENTSKGRSEEWNFSGSANFYDKLFVGLSLNLTHIKREEDRVYEESRDQQTHTDFESWSSSEKLKSNALGCNAKIGVIYHATQWLRFGCAFHTPTIHSFDESRQVVTESQFVSSGYHNYTGQESNYEYIFISPLKWVGGMAFVIGERGMISFDAEYTNYGAGRFKAVENDEYDYSETNASIKNNFGRTVNLRIGSEWRIRNSYLRMGAAYYGSPFGFGEPGGSIKKASCGLSLPLGASSSFDFAYEFSHGQTYLFLYDAGETGIESVTQSQFRHILLATLKVRF